MTRTEFERLKVGDHVLVRCRVIAPLLANLFHPDEPQHLEGWQVQPDHGSEAFVVIPEEVAGYALCPHPLHGYEDDFIVGDRVKWCSHDGWFIVHLIPETAEAVILHDDAGRGCRRTALSRLERIAS
jgi:hypothetical protein